MAVGWDVFISFKHLGADGTPTEASRMAEGLREALEERGIPAFFSGRDVGEVGDADYARVIDGALESATAMVVVGDRKEHFEAPWVRHEWGTFQNEILGGRKPSGQIFVFGKGLSVADLPIALRRYQFFPDGPSAVTAIMTHVANALQAKRLRDFGDRGEVAVRRVERLIELLAKSRLLEFEIMSGMFGGMFGEERRAEMERIIAELKALTGEQRANDRE